MNISFEKPQDRIKVLGIFTCFNRKQKTLKCLQTLVKGNPTLAFTFLAVDDGSTDGTIQALKELDNVEIIEGNGSLFYSGGMRLGIAAAKNRFREADYCLLFNDDVEFFAGSIERLIASFRDSNMILAGATCNDEGELSYGGVLKKSRFRPAFQIVMSDEKPVFCDTFNANCVLIPEKIFQKLPNIDPVYTHSLGDFDYGLSARKRGCLILASDFFVGKCIDNPVQGTWRDTKLSRKERLKRKESPKGLPRKEWYYFVKKHFGVVSAWVSMILPYIRIIIGK